MLATDCGILHLARHWLLAVNVLGGIIAALPVLAPWLLAHGATLPGRLIFLAYDLMCHQRPERSFFDFGRQMACCQRNTAIYTGLFALGLGYALVRWRLRPLRWRWMFLLRLHAALRLAREHLGAARRHTGALRARLRLGGLPDHGAGLRRDAARPRTPLRSWGRGGPAGRLSRRTGRPRLPNRWRGPMLALTRGRNLDSTLALLDDGYKIIGKRC